MCISSVSAPMNAVPVVVIAPISTVLGVFVSLVLIEPGFLLQCLIVKGHHGLSKSEVGIILNDLGIPFFNCFWDDVPKNNLLLELWIQACHKHLD